MFVATRRLRSRRRAPWWAGGLISLVLAVLVTFGYNHLTGAWTCRYDDQVVIVGVEYTAQARDHRQRELGASCETLIRDFAGRSEDIWIGEGINRRRSLLAALYLGAVALFTVSIVAVVEAITAVERTGRPARGHGTARNR